MRALGEWSRLEVEGLRVRSEASAASSCAAKSSTAARRAASWASSSPAPPLHLADEPSSSSAGHRTARPTWTRPCGRAAGAKRGAKASRRAWPSRRTRAGRGGACGRGGARCAAQEGGLRRRWWLSGEREGRGVGRWPRGGRGRGRRGGERRGARAHSVRGGCCAWCCCARVPVQQRRGAEVSRRAGGQAKARSTLALAACRPFSRQLPSLSYPLVLTRPQKPARVDVHASNGPSCAALRASWRRAAGGLSRPPLRTCATSRRARTAVEACTNSCQPDRARASAST